MHTTVVLISLAYTSGDVPSKYTQVVMFVVSIGQWICFKYGYVSSKHTPVGWLVGCFTSQVNSYGHVRTVGSPNHTFFLTKLVQAVNQYFVHILYAGGDSSKHMPVVMFQVNICQ